MEGRTWEKNIDMTEKHQLLPPICALTGDQRCNLRMCSEQESNPQHCGVWDDAPTNWATLARAAIFFKRTVLGFNYWLIDLFNKHFKIKKKDIIPYDAGILVVESVNHCGILASSRKVSNPSQHSVKVKGSLLLSSETDSGLIHRQSSPSLLVGLCFL